MNQPIRYDAYTTAVYSQCNVCAVYLNKGSILEHVFNQHTPDDEYKCRFCSYSGIRKVDLLRHQKAKHKFEQCFLACPICGFISAIEEDIHWHIQNFHFTNKTLSCCKYCSFQTEDSSKIRLHIAQMHSDYVCKYQTCRAICQNPYELFSHYMRHFPRLTLYYKCSDCECDYMHTMYSSLYQHQEDKHGIFDKTCDGTVVEIECQRCSYETTRKEHFKNHIRATNHNMLYYCPFKNCSYESDLFWSFTQHVTDKHLYEIAGYYYCFECGNGFPMLNSLIQHLRDKHDITDECTKCQSYEENLADHIDDDHDELYDEFLSCCFCQEDFEDKAELVDHLKADHSVNITSEVRAVANI